MYNKQYIVKGDSSTGYYVYEYDECRMAYVLRGKSTEACDKYEAIAYVMDSVDQIGGYDYEETI